MKKKGFVFSFMAVICIILLSIFISCANGSSDDSPAAVNNIKPEETPKDTATTVTDGTKSEGTVSKDAVGTNSSGQTIATITDSNGGVYEFTETGTLTQGIQSSASKTGIWVYKVKTVIKWSGSYTGDISKIGTEALSIEMVIEKTTNSIDEEVKVVTKKTFKMELTTTTFSTTVPKVVSGVLDLRIKGGTVANTNNVYDPTKTFEWGSVSGDTVKTKHVTATPYTNGIYIEIICPEDECYGGKLGYVAVREVSDENDIITRVEPKVMIGNKKVCFWPCCSAGQVLKFSVQIEPNDSHKYREYTYYETLTITATGGIGKIDYTNLKAKQWLTYGWENGRPVVRFDSSDLVMPNASNIRTSFQIFAGNGDWNTNNATIWCAGFNRSGAIYDFVLTDSEVQTLISAVKEKGKKQFIYQYDFEFDIPNTGTSVNWTTHMFYSGIIDLP